MLLTSSLLLHHLLSMLHHLLVVAVELLHLLPLQEGSVLDTATIVLERAYPVDGFYVFVFVLRSVSFAPEESRDSVLTVDQDGGMFFIPISSP